MATSIRSCVSGECLSACAEFLYLVDKPIIAAKNAKIGFHGDALTASRLVHPLGLTGPFWYASTRKLLGPLVD